MFSDAAKHTRSTTAFTVFYWRSTHLKRALTCRRQDGVILDHLRLPPNALDLLQHALLTPPLSLVGRQDQRGVIRRNGAQNRADRFGRHRCSRWLCALYPSVKPDRLSTTPNSSAAAEKLVKLQRFSEEPHLRHAHYTAGQSMLHIHF